MKENVTRSPRLAVRQASSSVQSFSNKFLQQDKSVMNQTFTLDTKKRDQMIEFKIDKALRGYITRSRSSDTYRRLPQSRDEAQKFYKNSAFSTTCKLPSLNTNNTTSDTRTCTMRPWSRTQEELKKYKELLN